MKQKTGLSQCPTSMSFTLHIVHIYLGKQVVRALRFPVHGYLDIGILAGLKRRAIGFRPAQADTQIHSAKRSEAAASMLKIQFLRDRLTFNAPNRNLHICVTSHRAFLIDGLSPLPPSLP